MFGWNVCFVFCAVTGFPQWLRNDDSFISDIPEVRSRAQNVQSKNILSILITHQIQMQMWWARSINKYYLLLFGHLQDSKPNPSLNKRDTSKHKLYWIDDR